METFDSVRDELAGLEALVAADRIAADLALITAQKVATETLTLAKAEAALVLAEEQARASAATDELNALKAAIAEAMAAEAATVEPVVIEVPKTIAFDGSADVGAKLSTFLASVQGPATVRFQPFGTYRVDDASVLVVRPTGITYDFNGASLIRTRLIDQRLRYPQRHGYFRLDYPTDVVVKNLRVQGRVTNDGSMEAAADATTNGKAALLDRNGTARAIETQAGLLPPHWPTVGDWGVYCVALAFEHAVDISGGVNVVVEDCWFDGIGGDGVGTTLDTTKNVTVRRVTVRRNGRQGISLVAGNGFLVEDCDIRSPRASIDIEPDTDKFPMTDIEVRGCTLASNLLPFASGGPGEIHDVFIHHNTITKGGVPVLHVVSNKNGLHQRRNWRFEDNVVVPAMSSALPLVRLTNVHGASVRRNKIARRATEAAGRLIAVGLERCSGVTVADNTFLRAAPVVFETDPVEPALVENNTV